MPGLLAHDHDIAAIMSLLFEERTRPSRSPASALGDLRITVRENLSLLTSVQLLDDSAGPSHVGPSVLFSGGSDVDSSIRG